MTEVREGLEGCDLLLMIVDVKQRPGVEDKFLVEMVKKAATPVVLLLNKVDLLGKEKDKLLPIIAQYQQLHEFREVIPISARKKDGLDRLLDVVVRMLPQGPRYFPEDQVTDQPTRFMASEIIREQVLLDTREEVPHATTVMVERFEEGKKLTRIAAVIYCERAGQKAILLGKGGQMLKKIGTAARLDIEKMTGTKVYLELFVKVKAGWRESPEFVEGLDWRRQLESLTGER